MRCDCHKRWILQAVWVRSTWTHAGLQPGLPFSASPSSAPTCHFSPQHCRCSMLLSNHSLPTTELALHILGQQVVLQQPLLVHCCLLCNRVSSTYVGADASSQLRPLEWLGHIVIGPTLEPFHNVLLLGFGRHLQMCKQPCNCDLELHPNHFNIAINHFNQGDFPLILNLNLLNQP